uniref:Uncharacterized protein n=1 Tax=Panagrolaimus sp. PS1159 TaxID=55785 RepID=A0AC35G5H5_9BILA
MPPKRSRGKAAAVISRERVVTRNRGKPTPSVLKRRSLTPPLKPRNKRKSNVANGKKPWEDSDGEVEHIKVEPILQSSDEGETDNDEEYKIENEEVKAEEEEEDADDSDVSFDLSQEDEETIICPWIEEDDVPQLLLPRPCHDLIVSFNLLMDLIQVYETVTTYYRLIQITPFLFEDFCAAMRVESATKLVADIHIALLKALLRDDEEQQTLYAVTETSVSFQILGQLLEPATYGEVLRQYVESDSRFPKEIAEILRRNYPFVSIGDRLKVLFWLCEKFVESSIVKQQIKTEGKIINESYCRECAKPGDLLLCDGCEASYHIKCLAMTDVPAGEWYCAVCRQNEVPGATDCEISYEKNEMHRKSPIGYDRHGRVYWFLVRRIIVEDFAQNAVYVYSTIPAIYELISVLDASHYEARLCANIYRILDKIVEQCDITLKMTHFRRDELGAKIAGNKELEQTYIDKDNAHRMIYIVYNVVTNLSEKSEVMEIDETTQDGVPANLPQKLERKILKHLGFENGRLTSTIWSFGVEQEHLVERRNEFVAALEYPPDIKALPLLDDYCRELNIAFRLSFSDGGYRKYDNIYDSNEYAKTTIQRLKEKDRKKYMSTKFSIDEPFLWAVTKGKNMFVDSNLFGRHIQITLRRIVERLPDELYHRLWKGHNKEVFIAKLTKATTPELLRESLLQFEACLRKPAFTNAWWSSLGHTSLIRQTHADRERRQYLDNLKKKEERELAIAESSVSNDIVWVNVPRQKNICKNLWRMKNEQYRLNGKGALGGWFWISKMYTKDLVDLPEKPQLGIDFQTPVEQLLTVASKKSSRLDKIVKKLSCWREAQEEEAYQISQPKCFSPSCGKSSSSFGGIPTKCYAYNCPKRGMSQEISPQQNPDTTSIVKAFDPVRRRAFQAELQSKTSANTRGEGIPFPFPVPFDYIHPKTKQRSILILPKFTLKKLSKTGGVKSFHIHGFNRSQKSNYNVWNYPCYRPIFDNCWRYLTHHATSLHSIALQLRILFASIRWQDLEPDWDEGESILISHPDFDEKRIVIGHKENPPDGYYEQYKLRVELIALDDDGIPPHIEGDIELDKDKIDISSIPVTTPSTKSTRKSVRRKSKKLNDSALSLRGNVTRKFVERWIDGVQLKLFEIVAYWKRFNEKKPQIRILTKSTPSENKDLRRFSTLQGLPAPKRTSPPSLATAIDSRKRVHEGVSPEIPNKIVVLDDEPETTPRPPARIITIDRRKQNFNGFTIHRPADQNSEPRNVYPVMSSSSSSQNGTFIQRPIKIIRRSDGVRFPASAAMNGTPISFLRPRHQLTPGPRFVSVYRPAGPGPYPYRESYRPSQAVRRILVHPVGRQIFMKPRPTQIYSNQSPQNPNNYPQ